MIQIIEDDFALRENTVELLELNGYKVASSSIDAKSSVEIFRSIKPDLIICDLEKLRSSGYDFIKLLKGDIDFIKVPLVFLTIEDSIPEWFKHNLINFFGCLKKPFSEEELLEAVALCLNNHNKK